MRGGAVDFREEYIAVIAMVGGMSGVALPAAIFSMARKWSERQPDLAGSILGGAVAVCIASILVGALIILAVIGWLPPARELFGG